MISETATRVGFSGGVVVDSPNPAKAKKHYLVLSFDRGATARKRNAGVGGANEATMGSQQHVTVLGASEKKVGKKMFVLKGSCFFDRKNSLDTFAHVSVESIISFLGKNQYLRNICGGVAKTLPIFQKFT